MSFEEYAVVELMGHKIIAGMVTEEEIAGAAFLRVDVPEVDGNKPFTKFFSPGAIYSVTPVDQDTCFRAVASYREKPIEVWRLTETISLPEPHDRDDEDDDISF